MISLGVTVRTVSSARRPFLRAVRRTCDRNPSSAGDSVLWTKDLVNCVLLPAAEVSIYLSSGFVTIYKNLYTLDSNRRVPFNTKAIVLYLVNKFDPLWWTFLDIAKLKYAFWNIRLWLAFARSFIWVSG